MKLAEALQERADLKIRLSNLCTRLTNNCLYQEDEKPAEDPAELLKEYDECASRFRYLVEKINLTNCRTLVGGKTLTEILAEKDAMSLRLSLYRNLVNTASSGAQKTTDQIARELRLLDNTVQAANWANDLIE